MKNDIKILLKNIRVFLVLVLIKNTQKIPTYTESLIIMDYNYYYMGYIPNHLIDYRLCSITYYGGYGTPQRYCSLLDKTLLNLLINII